MIIRLVKKAQRGNDKAFSTLFQECEAEVYRTAYLYVGNQNDALDVVQETAYRSFKSIKNLKEPEYFKTWLIRIAINCATDILRKKKNVVPWKPKFEELISEEVHEDIPLLITIRDLIELLTAEEKSVVTLRFYQDLTIKEVAETLSIPLGTAKTILYRSLKKLREDLKGDLIHEQ
nr:sigma-70 family RNA polymerase sigma factor [Sporosarcina limicola]